MRKASVAITRSYVQSIGAPPSTVFPLICPVREAEWLEGWACQLIQSDSGYAEEGCVFRTQPPGEPETIWFITRHDPAERVVEFARVTAGLAATRLRIQIEDAGDGRSSVRIRYTFVPTSEAGVRFVQERHSEEAFRGDMDRWERSMNHYIDKGTLLRQS